MASAKARARRSRIRPVMRIWDAAMRRVALSEAGSTSTSKLAAIVAAQRSWACGARPGTGSSGTLLDCGQHPRNPPGKERILVHEVAHHGRVFVRDQAGRTDESPWPDELVEGGPSLGAQPRRLGDDSCPVVNPYDFVEEAGARRRSGARDLPAPGCRERPTRSVNRPVPSARCSPGTSDAGGSLVCDR